MADLKYTPVEKISVPKTVSRIKYIKAACSGKNVLDLGCYDETALIKRDSTEYLFDEISSVSKLHIGVDNSPSLPKEGLILNEREKILFGDIYDLENLGIDFNSIDIIIAGELIEHLPDTLKFFLSLKKSFAGKRLICSTPNTTSFSNILLSFFSRESAHQDHLQVYSYKTLNTLCQRSGFDSWQIVPYHVKFSEMIMNSTGVKKKIVGACESIVNGIERFFPMTAGGYILDIIL
ncbi:class I SAM-dependent methyltransferase [Mucilaginibacter sp. RS28]|uniref:Class I SAM-dependent methyltransferase n=1 Tax=Mucilaginibacter straminoryzae TaxID=2932774 RepID=A0A9X1X5I9_9SPHI|nr:methyltransferase domain-containing protein [Mucilaginibacter straminoryzae]MCJ8211361.1 class I SAM-dependent methyltransferase [Mucilaginibacter straminoryzae]